MNDITINTSAGVMQVPGENLEEGSPFKMKEIGGGGEGGMFLHVIEVAQTGIGSSGTCTFSMWAPTETELTLETITDYAGLIAAAKPNFADPVGGQYDICYVEITASGITIKCTNWYTSTLTIETGTATSITDTVL